MQTVVLGGITPLADEPDLMAEPRAGEEPDEQEQPQPAPALTADDLPEVLTQPS